MLAERLSRYGRSLCDDDVPSAVVHEVKRRVLDSLGCALGAWTAPPCRIARQLAQVVTVPHGATLWGTGHRTLPDLAAFANGALVRYLDFNDTYLAKEPAHPSDNIAAILAVGETARASGKRVIQAIALAYEVQCRLCRRQGDEALRGTNTAGREPRGGSEHRIEADACRGSVHVESLRVLNAARNGVFAAMLAQRGMTGPSPIFEGEKGFMKLVSGPLDLPLFGGEKGSSEPVTFKILDTYLKHYPVEYHAQTAVEAALAIREDLLKAEGVDAQVGITDVEIGSYDVAIEIIGRDPEKWRPHTRETADHSFPYCVAVALLDGKVTYRSFDAKRLTDPALHALMEKVRVVPQPEFVGRYPQAMPTRITVRTKAGKDYVKQVDYPLGHPEHRMADHQVEDKFCRLAAGKLDRARMNKVIDVVWLDRLKDISALMPLLKLTGRG